MKQTQDLDEYLAQQETKRAQNKKIKEKIDLVMKECYDRLKLGKNDRKMRIINNPTAAGILKDTIRQIKEMNVYESTNKIKELKSYRDRLIIKNELQEEKIKRMISKPQGILRRSSSQISDGISYDDQSNEPKQIIKLELEKTDLNGLSTNFICQIENDELNRQRILIKNQSILQQKIDGLPPLNIKDDPLFQVKQMEDQKKTSRNNFRIFDYQRQINDFDNYYLNQGIDFDSDKIIPHQKFYNYYKKKTSALIDSVIKQKNHDISKQQQTQFDKEKELLSQRSSELLLRNHFLYRTHYKNRKNDQYRKSAPVIVLKELSVNQRFTHSKQDNSSSIEIKERGKNSQLINHKFQQINFENFNRKINKIEYDFKLQDQYMQKSLVELSEIISQTERKHNDKVQINLKIEKQDVNDFLLNTHKVWTSYLYKKKLNQFSRLRKLNILKSQQLEAKQK